MAFQELLATVQGRALTLTLLNVDVPSSVVTDVEAFFDPQNVTVRREDTASGSPRNVAVLHDGDETVAASPLATLATRLAPESGMQADDHLAALDYPDVLAHLDDQTFTEFGKRRMIVASREIETAAWDLGRGTLRAGFQYLSGVGGQAQVYRSLGESPVETHVYGVPDADPPADLPVAVHGIDAEEIAQFWFVLFDGDGVDAEKAGLLARQSLENTYSGFWTRDAGIVDRTLDHLTEAYDG